MNRAALPLPRSRFGFTMLELVIAISIGAILVALVPPALRVAANRIERAAAADQLVSDLQMARMQALKTNRSVTLRRTSDSTYIVTAQNERLLSRMMRFGPASADSVRFASFGPVLTGGASFVLLGGGATTTVSVNAAGYVAQDY